jgi:hypothetical protein
VHCSFEVPSFIGTLQHLGKVSLDATDTNMVISTCC